MNAREVQSLMNEAPRLVSLALARGWATKPSRQMNDAEVNRFRSNQHYQADEEGRARRKATRLAKARRVLLGEVSDPGAAYPVVPSPAPPQVQPQA